MTSLSKSQQQHLDRLIADLMTNADTKSDLLIYMLAAQRALFEQTGGGTVANIENILRGSNTLDRLIVAISPNHSEKLFS